MTLAWRSSCRTDVGKAQRVNEDSYLDLPEKGLWLVADGMGGHTAGDLASQLIVRSFDHLPQHRSIHEFSFTVKSRLIDANRLILSEARRRSGNVIVGSTVVAFLVCGLESCCIWAGDSRAYLLRQRELIQLTRDHSLVEALIDSGELLREDAARHPQKNVITRAIGTQDDLILDERQRNIEEGDKILLCSDGLNREITDDDIASLLGDYFPEEAAEKLVEKTLMRGARDNVTVVVIEIRSDDAAPAVP